MQAEAVANDDKIKSIQDGLESSFITLKEKYVNDWIDRSNLKISKSFQEYRKEYDNDLSFMNKKFKRGIWYLILFVIVFSYFLTNVF